MKRLPLALLLLAGCASGSPPTSAPAPVPAPTRSPASGAPAGLAVEGVPTVPPELARRLAQYQGARGASFEDWAADGSMLISTRFAETAQLHQVPFPGGRREQITFSDEPVTNGLFIPGTTDLLYSQAKGGNENWQIYRLDRKTGQSTLLTDGASRNSMGPLSHKGDRIVYSSNRRNGRDMDLYLLNLKTGTSETILETKGEFWSPADWSFDDNALALNRVISVNETIPATFEIGSRKLERIYEGGPSAAYGVIRFRDALGQMVISSDRGGEFRCLVEVNQLKRDNVEPRGIVLDRPWDVTEIEVHGDRVAFVRNEDGASKLYFLGEDAPVDLPVGVISGLKFSPDGRRIGFTMSRPDAPGDAYSYDIADRKLVRWTYSEVGGLDPSTFVVPKRFSYRSFDGREVPAYLYRPRGEAKKAPVVITIHGGPEAQYQPFFSPLIQFWVNELGLAVIAPNVRGSTGYGKTYTTLDNAEKREDSVKDIGALLDWVAAQPDLDASRVAVHGGSYGGYMVLASLVHFGDRIKAGVDVVGIANFITFLERTSGYRVDLRRVEYGDERDPKMREVFERISPANHADRIRSALLVAHGRNDPRVPFSEAEQIVAKVRANGRPVWTVYADNEGHGFARKENRDYFTAATALFFRKFLVE